MHVRTIALIAFAALAAEPAAAQTNAAGPAGASRPHASDMAARVADAAMKRDLAGVQALLRQKADVNAAQPDGATAMHWAVHYDDLPLVDALVAAGASATTPNRDGATPLQLACINGSAAMIDRLLNAGADPNERGPNGETALMMAARTGTVDAITLLIDRGADVNARETLRGTTALMWAAAQSHPSAVRVLVDRGADVAARSSPAPLGRTAYLAPTARQRQSEVQAQADAAVAQGQPRQARGEDGGRRGPQREVQQGGGLTPLVFAAREDDIETARILLTAGADVNQTTQYGWTPLLTAVQNRNYGLASFLLERGADPNIANKGGWTPLYLATDNRNIEGGDYPVRAGDMDHRDIITKLLAAGADVNARIRDSTETRTIFTMQWLYEDGATAFLRAAQSSDLELMTLLLKHGADPAVATTNNTTALAVAAGIGWVEGVTYERSEQENVQAVKMLLGLGLDPNVADDDGRTALHGAAHKGRTAVVQLLVDSAARLDARDYGSRDTGVGALQGRGWLPVDYADGLVRVGVQSAIPHPEAAALIRKLMKERNVDIPSPITGSVCITDACK